MTAFAFAPENLDAAAVAENAAFAAAATAPTRIDHVAPVAPAFLARFKISVPIIIASSLGRTACWSPLPTSSSKPTNDDPSAHYHLKPPVSIDRGFLRESGGFRRWRGTDRKPRGRHSERPALLAGYGCKAADRESHPRGASQVRGSPSRAGDASQSTAER